MVTSIHEGLENVPKMYGSKIRQQGLVKDWKSGAVEGGKVSSGRP